MSELSDLYQEVILDHNRSPRNFEELPNADQIKEGFNPLCGDRIQVFIKYDGDKIEKVTFTGSGCAISKASSSMMTASLKGKTKKEAIKLFEEFQEMVTSKPKAPKLGPDLGKLTVFSGVCEFPARIKCASLAWHTLRAILKNEKKVVTI